jgi:hypothetical protein
MRSPFIVPLALLTAFCSSCARQVPAAAVAPPGDKIALSPAMVLNESARGDAGQLVDEQELSGDPRDGKGGKPSKIWTVGFQGKDLYYPLSAFIDLGAGHHLSDVFIYDANSTGNLTIETGTPAKWEPLFADPLTSYQKWNRHPVDVSTRYLHVVIADPSTLAPEIVLYGTAEGPLQTATVPAPKTHPLPTMDELIGTNAFIDDPIDRMVAVGFVREYHSWAWDAGITRKAPRLFPITSWRSTPRRLRVVTPGSSMTITRSLKALVSPFVLPLKAE